MGERKKQSTDKGNSEHQEFKNKRKYRLVDPRIWNDDKFLNLADECKLVFLHLLTHPMMTGMGLIRSTPQALAAELRWKPEPYLEAFKKLADEGMVHADPIGFVICLPNWFKYNLPESPNALKGIWSMSDMIPECAAKNAMAVKVFRLCSGRSDAFNKLIKNLSEGLGLGIGLQMNNEERIMNSSNRHSLASIESLSPEQQKAAAACKAMRVAGCIQTNPQHLQLLMAIKGGATTEEFEQAAKEAIGREVRAPFMWACGAVLGRQQDAIKAKRKQRKQNGKHKPTGRGASGIVNETSNAISKLRPQG